MMHIYTALRRAEGEKVLPLFMVYHHLWTSCIVYTYHKAQFSQFSYTRGIWTFGQNGEPSLSRCPTHLVAVAKEMTKLPSFNETTLEILKNLKYSSWFKDCEVYGLDGRAPSMTFVYLWRLQQDLIPTSLTCPEVCICTITYVYGYRLSLFWPRYFILSSKYYVFDYGTKTCDNTLFLTEVSDIICGTVGGGVGSEGQRDI